MPINHARLIKPKKKKANKDQGIWNLSLITSSKLKESQQQQRHMKRTDSPINIYIHVYIYKELVFREEEIIFAYLLLSLFFSPENHKLYQRERERESFAYLHCDYSNGDPEHVTLWS